MQDKHYLLKIFILVFTTGAGVFVIWWAAIRPEGADWISGQVVHEASPFAISEIADGTLVSNVIAGYELTVPVGLKVFGSKNLIFLSKNAAINCQIELWSKTAPKQRTEQAKEVSWQGNKLLFSVISDADSQASCEKYFEQIKRSFSSL